MSAEPASVPPLPEPRRPDQGLLTCPHCCAFNLPHSVYCCLCGQVLPGGPLDEASCREVEELVRQAREAAAGGPVLAVEADTFHSRQRPEEFSVWPAAPASPYFLQEGQLQCFEQARVLLTDDMRGPLQDMVPFLETVARDSAVPLVVVSDDYDPQVLATWSSTTSKA